MARIALPDGEQLEVVKALTLRPDLAAAVGGFDAAVWNSSLDWRLHELVRMRVATINECTVCLGWRTPMAVKAGVTDDDLHAVT
ncbi:MAG: carboxymuconolactone decarboxylase family protein, partial [Acidimicrobiia bacterium]